jgi:hypothetical protein
MKTIHVPMTLAVEAEGIVEAHHLAIAFERTRESFSPPYRWLHVGLSPEAMSYTEQMEELIRETGGRQTMDEPVAQPETATVDLRVQVQIKVKDESDAKRQASGIGEAISELLGGHAQIVGEVQHEDGGRWLMLLERSEPETATP